MHLLLAAAPAAPFCRPGTLFSTPPLAPLLLDLQQYEKNVRKGRLNDLTIGLWDTPALQVRLAWASLLLLLS